MVPAKEKGAKPSQNRNGALPPNTTIKIPQTAYRAKQVKANFFLSNPVIKRTYSIGPIIDSAALAAKK